VSIRNMLEELGGKLRKTGKSRTRKYLLVALCVLLSLNMVLAVVPGAVFAEGMEANGGASDPDFR